LNKRQHDALISLRKPDREQNAKFKDTFEATCNQICCVKSSVQRKKSGAPILENLSIFRLWLKPVVSAKLRARPVFTLLVGLLPPVGQYLYITFHKIGTCSQMKEKEFTLTRPNVMASGKRPARAGGHVLTCTTVDHERLGY